MKTAIGACWLLLSLTAAGLSGCAGGPGVASAMAGKADLVTESDEPESR